MPARPEAVPVDPRLLAACVGRYEVSAGRTFIVTGGAGGVVGAGGAGGAGGTLRGAVPGRPPFELIPASVDRFVRYSEVGGFRDEIVFVRDADGRVTHAVLRDRDQEVWRAEKTGWAARLVFRGCI